MLQSAMSVGEVSESNADNGAAGSGCCGMWCWLVLESGCRRRVAGVGSGLAGVGGPAGDTSRVGKRLTYDYICREKARNVTEAATDSQ